MILNKQNLALAAMLFTPAEAFSPSAARPSSRQTVVKVPVSLQAQKEGNSDNNIRKNIAQTGATLMLGAGIVGSIFFPGAAFAGEIGVEVEAPTLYTGETVEVRRHDKVQKCSSLQLHSFLHGNGNGNGQRNYVFLSKQWKEIYGRLDGRCLA